MSKYKSIFAKGFVSNWSEEVFVVAKVKKTVSWANVISDLKSEEIAGTFCKKRIAKNKSLELKK